MSESKESKKNPIVNYFQESYEELKKVTWPTRNQAVKLTFIVIGFCIFFALVVGGLDFAFNTGYRSLVNFSNQFAPPPTPVTDVTSGEPAPSVDLSNIKVTPDTTPASEPVLTPVGTTTVTGSTQQ